MEEILIQSTKDNTLQPSLFRRAVSEQKRPLLVGLHSWSFGRTNQKDVLLPWAEKYNLHLLLPEFRGPNLTDNPDRILACGSEYAMQDIKDAIDWAIREENADPAHVFLYGGSGGGHMALMMAGFCPDCFAAIAAFVPITDLEKWAEENAHYRPHILACCSEDEAEMAKRSPMSYIDNIARANVKIFHGKYDPVVLTPTAPLYSKPFRRNIPAPGFSWTSLTAAMRQTKPKPCTGSCPSTKRSRKLPLPDKPSGG